MRGGFGKSLFGRSSARGRRRRILPARGRIEEAGAVDVVLVEVACCGQVVKGGVEHGAGNIRIPQADDQPYTTQDGGLDIYGGAGAVGAPLEVDTIHQQIGFDHLSGELSLIHI